MQATWYGPNDDRTKRNRDVKDLRAQHEVETRDQVLRSKTCSKDTNAIERHTGTRRQSQSVISGHLTTKGVAVLRGRARKEVDIGFRLAFGSAELLPVLWRSWLRTLSSEWGRHEFKSHQIYVNFFTQFFISTCSFFNNLCL